MAIAQAIARPTFAAAGRAGGKTAYFQLNIFRGSKSITALYLRRRDRAMMFAISALEGCAVNASDGDVGTVKDILFDDEAWRIR